MRTTELEDKLYEALQNVKAYLTRHDLERWEYLDLMALVMASIKLYENKKHDTKFL